MFGPLSALMLAAVPQPPLAPETRSVVQPVAPPGLAVVQMTPNSFTVTNLPGVAVSKQVSIQRFPDYDLNRDGAYGRMEFAQAMYFLATGDPVPGTAAVPRPSQYVPHQPYATMDPELAAALINATSDEFTAIDQNQDWRITPAELARSAA